MLKCLATLLIVNSHCEAIWPKPWLAADGMIGGGLFFLIAGFALVLASRVKQRPFLIWYWRRIVRVYPAVWITVVLMDVAIAGSWRSWTPLDYIATLIWPTNYSFVHDIVWFYIIFFFLLKIKDARVFLLAIGLVTVPYLVTYLHDIHGFTANTHLELGHRPWAIARVFYAQMMLLGGWLGCRVDRVHRTSWSDFLVLGLLSAIYVGAKYEMVVQGRFATAYPALHLLGLAIAFWLCRISQSDKLLSFMQKRGAVQWVIALLAGLTMEIYVVHEYLLANPHLHYAGGSGWRVPFPLNLLTIIGISVVWAYLTAQLISRLRLSSGVAISLRAAGRFPVGARGDRT